MKCAKFKEKIFILVKEVSIFYYFESPQGVVPIVEVFNIKLTTLTI